MKTDKLIGKEFTKWFWGMTVTSRHSYTYEKYRVLEKAENGKYLCVLYEHQSSPDGKSNIKCYFTEEEILKELNR